MYEEFEGIAEKLDETVGFKHTVQYKDENLYVSIFPMRCEVFISSVKQDQDPLTGAAIDMASRLVTLAWKGSTLDVVIEQLRRSSRSTRDLPGILASLLAEDFDE